MAAALERKGVNFSTHRYNRSVLRPDYRGGGLVNLMASLARARGGDARHAPLALLPPAEIAGARNLLFVIVDGLGARYLERHGAGGALARHCRGTLTSVFPSTTATAITTSYTGLTPLEHGLTGWFTYFHEAGCVAAPLPFKSRGDQLSLRDRGVVPESLFPSASIFDALPVRSRVVSYRPILDSDYNVRHCGRAERIGYDDLAGFVAACEAAVTSDRERKFVYAYWPQFDALSHRHGNASPEVRTHFAELDAAFAELLARLAGTDTAVVATADHGFMDSMAEDCVELPAALAPLLRYPLCGERRVAFCHVHDLQAYLEKARSLLGECADVRPSGELLAEGWFGAGTPHPRIAERVGDVAILMRDRYTLKDWVAGEPRHLHIGNHGGASEDEMLIPLIVRQA